jgi:hypothetical protein
MYLFNVQLKKQKTTEMQRIKCVQKLAPVEMMSAWPVGLMLAFAHGSIFTLAS